MSQKPLSLLEKKKLQWEKEKEELIGLWSPWGRPPSLKGSTSCISLTDESQHRSQVIGGHISRNPVILTSTFMNNLDLYGNSQSEYHLPPIGLETQQSRDPTDGLRDQNRDKIGTPYWLSRKRSLPSCISSSTGEVCSQFYNYGQEEQIHQNEYHANQNNRVAFKDQTNHQLLSERKTITREKSSKWGLKVAQQEEDTNTSGYQSENNGLLDDSRHGSGESEKDAQLFRRYSSIGNLNKSIHDSTLYNKGHQQDSFAYTTEVDYHPTPTPWNKPSSYLYSKRNEMSHYSMGGTPNVTSDTETTNPRTWHYVNSRVHIPPPAMRSSFTHSIEAPDKDAYKDVKKMEHEQWLKALEKQREEQRMRKQIEKEDKCGRWGDHGVVVGHLWEPASAPTARLPSQGADERYSSSNQIPRWSALRESYQQDPSVIENQGMNDRWEDGVEQSRSYLRGQNIAPDPDDFSDWEKKKQQAFQHQEAIRKQMDERQQKLKEEREKRIEEERAEEAKLLIYRLERLKQLEIGQRQKLIKEQEAEFEQQQNGNGLIENHEYTQPPSNPSTNSALSNFISRDTESNETVRRNETENLYLVRKNLVTTFTLPPINPLNTIAQSPVSPKRHGTISPFQDYEATVSYPDNFKSNNLILESQEAVVASFSRSQSTVEFGTQTESMKESAIAPPLGTSAPMSEINSTSTAPAKDGETESKEKRKSKKKERPKWGIQPPTKQYVKQSEKDPHYQFRLQKRNERLKRRENQLFKFTTVSERVDTGTDESEDLKSHPRITKGNQRRPSMSKSKQKNISNGNIYNSTDSIPTRVTHAQVELLETRVKENDAGAYTTFPIISKPPPTKVEILKFYDSENDDENQSWRSTPSILDIAEVQVYDNVTNVVGLRTTNSPPVPALMKKMQEAVLSVSDSQRTGVLNQIEPHVQENDSISKISFPQLVQQLSSKDSHQFKGSNSVSTGTHGLTPNNVSEVGLFPESPNPIDTYDSSPTKGEKLIYKDSLKFASSCPKSPLSPPSHVKQLIFGLQNLGTYFSLSPTEEQVQRDTEFPNFEPKKHPLNESSSTIEFTIKLPAGYYQKNFQSLSIHSESERNQSGHKKSNVGARGQTFESGYSDPLVEDRKKSTIEWLRTSSNESTRSYDEGSRRNILARLSALKEGIRNQQEEWGILPSESENGNSPCGSSFYPSSEKSLSSNY